MPKPISSVNIATAYGEYLNLVILSGIGGKNTETETATTYNSFVVEDAAPNLDKWRTYINNNWESAKVFPNCPDDAAKVAYVPKLVRENLDKFATPAKVQTPLHRAVQNILARMFPNDVAGLSGAALTKALSANMERFIVSGSLEKYRAMIDAELVLIASETDKRSRRDGTAASEDGGLVLDFETDETADLAAD